MEYSKLTFHDDSLKRKTFVENVMNVINGWDNGVRHENESLVLSLNASWGSGKSYLIHMWKNWLLSDENSTKNYAVTYYNAWENDDCENAFVPLIYKLQELDMYKKDTLEGIKAGSKDFLKSCGIALAKDGIRKFIGTDTADLFGKGFDALNQTKVENFFKEYKTYINEKDKFRKVLSKLIPKDGKLIIFIDELDRCRPPFAIETLEIVKHFFNIKNIVFIFAIDLDQLSYSIATLYGHGMDASGYLRRFFDFNINIPNADIKKYTYIMFNDFFKSKNIFLQNEFIIKSTDIYTKLNLSLRDIDKISNNFKILFIYYEDLIEERIESGKAIVILEVFLYFMVLKYKYPQIYDLILKQNFVIYGERGSGAEKTTEILDFKYILYPTIYNLLKNLQMGDVISKDKGPELINSFSFETINKNISFSEHIERTLEMFSPI